MKKYEFTGETKVIDDMTLHQIRALIDFNDVLAGDIGGWIEKEGNLSHDDDAWVSDNAEVSGNAWVYGNAKVYGNAWVFSTAHILVIGPIGSRNDFITFYRDKDNEITVKCGCFLGKIDVFLDKVTDTHGDSKHAAVYRAAAALAELQIGREETTP